MVENTDSDDLGCFKYCFFFIVLIGSVCENGVLQVGQSGAGSHMEQRLSQSQAKHRTRTR